jgi:hypothetical protein
VTPAEFERMRRRAEARDDVTWRGSGRSRWGRAEAAAVAFLALCAASVAAIAWSVVR